MGGLYGSFVSAGSRAISCRISRLKPGNRETSQSRLLANGRQLFRESVIVRWTSARRPDKIRSQYPSIGGHSNIAFLLKVPGVENGRGLALQFVGRQYAGKRHDSQQFVDIGAADHGQRVQALVTHAVEHMGHLLIAVGVGIPVMPCNQISHCQYMVSILNLLNRFHCEVGAQNTREAFCFTRNPLLMGLSATPLGNETARIGTSQRNHEEALTYFDNALKIASTIPDIGYPFLTKEDLLEDLVDIKRSDAAQRLADEILTEARQRHHPQAEAIVLTFEAHLAMQRHDQAAALDTLQQSMALSESGGFVRELAEEQALASDIYRDRGELEKATEFANLAANSTQESGDTWSVPRRLQSVAVLDIKQGKYDEADRIFDRASAFVDALIGNYSSVLEKTAVIKASSELYSQHFALIADRFNDPRKAYSIIEQVRGRVQRTSSWRALSLLPQAKKDQRAISELRLKLAAARSTR